MKLFSCPAPTPVVLELVCQDCKTVPALNLHYFYYPGIDYTRCRPCNVEVCAQHHRAEREIEIMAWVDAAYEKNR